MSSPSSSRAAGPAVPTCGCQFHDASQVDHGDVEGTYDITSVCPSCHEADTLRLCTDRVLSLLGAAAAPHQLTCPICHDAAPATAYWRDIHPTRGSAPRQGSCTPGRSCIAC